MTVRRVIFAKNPIEELRVGEGKRIRCIWEHNKYGICPGSHSVRNWAKGIGFTIFVLCRSKELWIGRYG